MAGADITEDLAIGLKTTLSNAEYIKTHYGVALANSVDPDMEIGDRRNQWKSISKKISGAG